MESIVEDVKRHVGKDLRSSTSAAGDLVIEVGWTTDSVSLGFFSFMYNKAHNGVKLKYTGIDKDATPWRVTFVFEYV